MKLCNIGLEVAVHLAAGTARGGVDLTAAGCPRTRDEVSAGAGRAAPAALAAAEGLPVGGGPV